MLVRAVVAILVGLIVAGVLDLFGLLTPHLDALIGLLVAIVVFYRWEGPTGRVV